MTGLPLFLLVGFLALLVAIHLAGRRYRALWKTDHVIDLIEGIVKLRREADAAGDGSAAWTSSAGYRFAYRIAPEDGEIAHRIDLSFRGRGFAVTAAGFLAALVRETLDLEPLSPNLRIADDGRYRLGFRLAPEEHRRRMTATVAAVDPEEAAELTRRCWARSRELRATVRRAPEEDTTRNPA